MTGEVAVLAAGSAGKAKAASTPISFCVVSGRFSAGEVEWSRQLSTRMFESHNRSQGLVVASLS